MYFSRVQIMPGPGLFKIIKRDRFSNGYAVHQLLWSLFPNDGTKKRDFLYREDNVNGFPQFYIVSQNIPVSNDAVTIDCKEYHPVLKCGDRLHFTLIANPVKAKKEEGKKHSAKHDIWMDAKKNAKDEGKTDVEVIQYCEEIAKKWLLDRAEKNGFKVDMDEIIVDGYIQHRFTKAKGGKEIVFSSLSYEGILTVQQPDCFIENTLFRGIGSARAFGCGLMMVKRI